MANFDRALSIMALALALQLELVKCLLMASNIFRGSFTDLTNSYENYATM